MLCTGLTTDASSYVKKWRATLAKLTRPLVNGENRRSLFPAVKLLPLFLVPRQRTEQVREKQRCVSPVQTDQFTLIDPRSVATVDTGLFVTAPNAGGHVENFLLAGEISLPVCGTSICSCSCSSGSFAKGNNCLSSFVDFPFTIVHRSGTLNPSY